MNALSLAIHGVMLADKSRNGKLAAAIESLIRPGDVVIDIGAGSGFLSMLASRAGARKVYAIEMGSMATVAERLVDLNGFGDTISVIKTSSFNFEPPERADVILCETLGIFAFDEGLRPILLHARESMLKRGGRILPASVRIVAAPAIRPQDVVDITQMDAIHSLDFSPLGDVFRRIYRRCYLPERNHITAPKVVIEQDCYRMACATPIDASVDFVIQRASQVDGFGLWFEADLTDGIQLASGSSDPSNHWGQVFLPLPRPMVVSQGDSIRLNLRVDDRDHAFSANWRAEHVLN